MTSRSPCSIATYRVQNEGADARIVGFGFGFGLRRQLHEYGLPCCTSVDEPGHVGEDGMPLRERLPLRFEHATVGAWATWTDDEGRFELEISSEHVTPYCLKPGWIVTPRRLVSPGEKPIRLVAKRSMDRLRLGALDPISAPQRRGAELCRCV